MMQVLLERYNLTLKKHLFGKCFQTGTLLLCLTFQHILVVSTFSQEEPDLLPPVSLPQQSKEIQQLKLGQPVEKKITGTESNFYKVKLTTNQAVIITVTQRGVDLALTLRAPDGSVQAEADSPNGAQGNEEILVIANQDGDYQLEIKPYEPDLSRGSYRIAIKTLRLANIQDKNRFKAYQIAAQANELRSKGEADSMKASLKKNEEALQIQRKANDIRGQALSLHKLGETNQILTNLAQAINYYEKSLPFWRGLGEKSAEAVILSNMGLALDDKGEALKATRAFEQALILFRKVGERQEEANINNNIGRLYYKQSQYPKALEHFNQALVVFHSFKDSREANVLANIGTVYAAIGEYRKAIDSLTQALPLLKSTGDNKAQGFALTTLGDINFLLGNNEKAVDSYTQALTIFKAIGERFGETQALNNIGKLYFLSGDTIKGKEFLEKALTVSSATGDKLRTAYILNNIGLIYLKEGDKVSALKYSEKALPLLRSLKNLHGEAQTFDNIGTILLASGESQKAIENFTAALLINRQAKERAEEGNTLSNLMIGWKTLNNPNLAILYGKQAINIYQSIRFEIKKLAEELQKSFLKEKELTYRKLADILISEGRLPEAQAVLDLLKEEEFKQINRKSGEPLFNLPYSRAEEATLKTVDNLAALGRELSDLKAKPKDTLSATETKRLSELEIVEIPAANKSLRLAIEGLSKVAPNVKNTLDSKIKENIQNILPSFGKGVVALYTVVGKTVDENAKDKDKNNKVDIGWILLVTPEFRKAYPIDTTDLEQTVFKFRQSLLSPNYDPQPIAQELYKKLFLQTPDKQKTTLAADLESYLGGEKDKTLMWSLDGVLRYIPIAALHDGKSYLVEKYRNSVFNTASFGTLIAPAKPNWEVAGLGISAEGIIKDYYGKTMRFEALKDSEIELNSLVKEKNKVGDEGIFSGTLKINNEFTKEALFEGARSGSSIVHISSHFYFNTAQEKTSFLVLGNGNRLEMTEFEDYPNLFSNVDLLSLSACDTATGSASVVGKADATETNGKEVEGFAYQTQSLGAKSVMASLWMVSALGTKELMLKFYQIKKELPELPKGEALRQAQLSLLRGTTKAGATEGTVKGVEEQGKALGLKPFKKDEKMPFAHPYYWSSFILIGNWR